MKRFLWKLKGTSSSSSSSSSSRFSEKASHGGELSRHGTSMEEDITMIFDDTDLDLVGAKEIGAYNSIKDRAYLHTKAYDPALLSKIGIYEDFVKGRKLIGWEDFAEVPELGSRFLTIQFLSTLIISKEDVTFRFFRKEYHYTWKEFSLLLGFHRRCAIDLDHAVSSFNRIAF